MAATMAGETTFEFDGKTYRCQTKEQAMHHLGFNSRWVTAPQARQQDELI